MDTKILIIGGGISGLVAAYLCPFDDVTIVDKDELGTFKGDPKALIHFERDIGKDLGIELHQIRSHRWIYYRGEFINYASPKMQLEYSQKILKGIVRPTTFDFLDFKPVTTYLPEGGMKTIIEHLSKKVKMKGYRFIKDSVKKIEKTSLGNTVFLEGDHGQKENSYGFSYGYAINTIPLFAISELCGFEQRLKSFPTTFLKSTVKDLDAKDIHYVVFFPHRNEYFYRMILQNNEVVFETMENDNIDEEYPMILGEARGTLDRVFGLGMNDKYETFVSPCAKFVGDKSVVKGLMRKLTKEHSIYSLGRYATWSFKRTDDVVEDAKLIFNWIEQEEKI